MMGNKDLKAVTLHDVSDDLMRIMDMIADEEIDQEQATDLLAHMQGTLKEKATNVAAYTGNMEFMIKGIKERENQLAKRRKAIENHVSWLKGYLKFHMEKHEITEIESPDFVLKIKKNPHSVVIDNEAEIPSDFITVETTSKPNKNAIKEALKSGEDVAGCHLTQTNRLDIK